MDITGTLNINGETVLSITWKPQYGDYTLLSLSIRTMMHDPCQLCGSISGIVTGADGKKYIKQLPFPFAFLLDGMRGWYSLVAIVSWNLTAI